MTLQIIAIEREARDAEVLGRMRIPEDKSVILSIHNTACR